jgi:Fic family protein
MDPKDFHEPSAGKAIRTLGGYWAFIPASLPPQIEWSAGLVSLHAEAERALASLSWTGGNFPESHIMVKSFIRREAVLSSRIEGTRASLTDVYTYEAVQLLFLEPDSDAREVYNYVRALDYGLKRVATLPISLRLIRELHQRLLEGVRGEILTPGEFRRTPNWIGPAGSTLETAPFVPPPVDEMNAALGEVEKFIHVPSDLPPLTRIGLIHYQFEAIHPFLDGNGRVGRLLMSLLLCQWGLLSQPLLYLSAFLERRRSEYYKRLLAISQAGDWEGWLRFFLIGVRDQAVDATRCIQALQALRQRYYERLTGQRDAPRLRKVFDFLLGHPIATVRQVQSGLGLSDYKMAQRYVDKLAQSGLLREVTGHARNRLYYADEILKVIQEPVEGGHGG